MLASGIDRQAALEHEPDSGYVVLAGSVRDLRRSASVNSARSRVFCPDRFAMASSPSQQAAISFAGSGLVEQKLYESS